MAVDANGNPIIEKTAEQLEQENKSSEAEKRIKQLSEKVRLTAEERDEKDKILKEKDDKIGSLEKENAFNSGFSDILGTHSAAKDHKDEIKAKFAAGYTLEDATFAVLGKVGKLGQTGPAAQVAGGSASTVMPQGGQKEIKDMNLAEKRAILEKELLWQ